MKPTMLLAALAAFALPSCASQKSPMADAMSRRIINESQPVMVQTANGPMMMSAASAKRESSQAFNSFYGGGL